VKDTDVAGLLLDQFEIYVVPMVNPDGVIHGYSRTNMAGLDLNRQWSDNILKVILFECSN
jgi:murein tripeptide amidase MpaA